MDLSGRRLGEFTLREQIGEGGCAVVYRCEQPQLRRNAVVKVLHERGQRSDAALDRFRREAQLASQLDHPYAAHVYAFGDEDDGLFWIAMELVQGTALDDWLDAHGPMPLAQFVPFFECVADVVHAAHERGIIHRDLKPSNVMVIERNGRLFPKLLDFGIAKLTGEFALPAPEHPAGTEAVTTAPLRASRRRAQRTHTDPAVKDHRLTRTSAKLGSTAYMSPEQWTAPQAVGPASDLYSLGVLAYEVLTGRKPFAADSTHEYYHQHVYVEAPPLGDGFPPEVDRVVRRALAKAPEARHGNALELAAAFQAALRAEPHEQLRAAALQWEDRARSPDLLWGRRILTDVERSVPPKTMSELECSFVVESQRRIRRIQWAQRALVALGALVVVGGLLYRAATKARQATLQTELAQKQTQLAQEQARSAKAVTEATVTQAELEQGRAALLHGEMTEAQRHLDEAWRRGDQSPSTAFMYARALQPLRAELARLPAISGRMRSAIYSPDGKQIATTDDASAQIWNSESYQPLFTLPHGGIVYYAVYTKDGARLVTAAGDGAVHIWDPVTGDLVRELRLPDRMPQWSLIAVSPDGRLAAAADLSGTIAAAWDANTGTVLTKLALDGGERPSLRFSVDGRWLAAGGGKMVQVLETASWRTIAVMPGGRVAWDPTAPRLITGSVDGDASIWSVTSGARLHHLHESGEAVDALAYSPDGQRIALALRSGAVEVFEAATARATSTGNHLRDKLMSIEFDPSSRLVVTAGVNGAVAVSEAATGMSIAILEGPSSVVCIAHFDPSSRHVVAASWDGTTRVWDASSPYRRWNSERLADSCGLVGGAETHNSRLLAVGCSRQVTRIWDTSKDQLVAELPALKSPSDDMPVPFPAVSATGDRAALARGNAAEIYTLPGGRLARVVAHGAAVTAVTFAPSGELVSGDAGGRVLTTSGDQEPIQIAAGPTAIDALAVLPGGRLAVAGAGGRVRVLDMSGATVATFDTGIRSRMLRPSPEGSWLLAVPSISGNTALPTVLDLERGAVARLDGPHVYSARWVPGGVLTAHADGAARLWSPDGTRQRTYRGGPRFLVDAALTPDGEMVIGGGGDGSLHFWDAATGRQLWTLPAHKLQILGIEVSARGIVTRGDGGEVSRWSLPDSLTVIGAGKIEAVDTDP